MVLNRGIGLIAVVVIAFMCANVGIDSVGAFGPPEIRILSPEEGVSYPSNEIYLEVAANVSLVNWSYSLNGAAPISFNPNTATIRAQEGSNSLTVSAADLIGVVGNSKVSFIVDTKPPAIICPADVTVEQATRNGTAVFLNVTASDLSDPNPVLTSNELAVYPPGTTTVTFIATDASGNSANCSVNVSVVDTTPPEMSCPANVTIEQMTGNGTAVLLNVTVSDISDPNPNVTSNELAMYPPGTTIVTFTATDASGNSANCSVYVTVGDTTAPKITCPADVTVEQTTMEGTAVPLDVTVTDFSDPNPVVTSNELAIYPPGTTTVTFTATDSSGNSANCSVYVTVGDTTAPKITCPADVTVEQKAKEGTAVPLDVTVTDLCDPDPVVTSNELAIYPPGTTTVTFTATDASGNSASCSVDVTVGDTTSPMITCPGDVTIEQTTVAGAAVTLDVIVTDFGDPNPVVTSNELAIYPPGTTTVTFTATDASGNSASCSVDVTVGDTTAPEITCPADVTVEQTTVEGTAVTLDVTVTDLCDPNPVVTSNELAIYPPGTTTVTFTATDSSGNSASCSVTVTVVDTTPPEITCPADVRVEQGASGVTIVPLNVTAYDICDPNPVVTSNAPDTYPLGTTNVTFTATDASGNSANCSVTVTVFDITPPEVTIISPVDRVTYESTSVDLIYTVNEPTKWVGYSLDGAENITISGDTILEKLQNGPHNLTVFAEDLSGNRGSSTVDFGVFAVAPTITNINLSSNYALPGDLINISVDAFDFSGVRWVRAFVTKGGEDIWPFWLTPSATEEDIYSGTWNILIFEEGGIYNVTIEATDTEGNVATSSPQEVVIPIDSEGPNATDINVSPTSAKPGDKIIITANVTDAISDVRRVRGSLAREGGDPMTVFMSDPEDDGIYTGTWNTMIFTESGIYHLDILTADSRGNEALFRAPSIEIIPTPVDTEAPNITNMVVSPTRADSGTSIELSAEVTDALSGVRDVRAIVSKGGEEVSTVFLMDREKNGIYTGTWRTMVFTDGGIYNIDIIATDESGNVASVKAPDVEMVGDQEGPAITAVTVDPNNVPPGTSVSITAYANDSSGIRNVKAIVKKEGTPVITIYMPPDAEAEGAFTGTWHTFLYETAATYSADIVATDVRGNELLIESAVNIVIDS